MSTNDLVGTSSYNGFTLQAEQAREPRRPNPEVLHVFQEHRYRFLRDRRRHVRQLGIEPAAHSIPDCGEGYPTSTCGNVLAMNAIWMVRPRRKGMGFGPRRSLVRMANRRHLHASSGLPFTPRLGGDPLGLKSADLYAFPNRMTDCNPVNSNFKQNNMHYLNQTCFTLPTAPAVLRVDVQRLSSGATPIPQRPRILREPARRLRAQYGNRAGPAGIWTSRCSRTIPFGGFLKTSTRSSDGRFSI